MSLPSTDPLRGAVLLVAAAATLAAQAGRISGIVVDDSGSPVQGAVVVARRIRELARDQSGRLTLQGQLYSPSANSDQAGQFAIPAGPTGDYEVCVYGALGYISNCQWGAVTPTAHVDSATGLSGLRLTLSRGTIVKFVVNDPLQKISGGHWLYPSVATSRGYFAPARLQSASGGLRNYAVTIPKWATVGFFVDSDLSLTDATAASVPIRTVYGSVSGAEPPVTVSLNVR